MIALLFVVLQSAPVQYGEALIRQYGTYSMESCKVRVEPIPLGARIQCDIRLKVRSPGPLHFLLTRKIQALQVIHEGKPVARSVVGGGIDALVKIVAGNQVHVPQLLAVHPKPALPPGATTTLRFDYLWLPGGGAGAAYARGGSIQTHLTSFWLPTMANQRFDAEVEVITPGWAAAPGEVEPMKNGWRFKTVRPVQILSLVVGDYKVHDRGTLQLLAPAGLEVDADALLADVEQVLDTLEKWFGKRADKSFRVVIDPAVRPAPSYCGGNFVVLHRTATPGAMSRIRWLNHLAHECSHAWWGHSVATPVIGRGGTWLREGTAQWCGIKVTGQLLGGDAEERLWRAHAAAYMAGLDLRRGKQGLIANEPTLSDASGVDAPRVAYWRGALVLRRLEQRMRSEAFKQRLGELTRSRAGKLLDLDAFATALGTPADIAYYAGTSRLPDFALDEVDVSARRARVRCLDAKWPDGEVPCRVETEDGVQTIQVPLKNGEGELRWTGNAKRIELDSERVLLDPIHSNNVWSR